MYIYRNLKKLNWNCASWYMSLILAFKRQRQVDLFEFEARLVYIVSSKPTKTT